MCVEYVYTTYKSEFYSRGGMTEELDRWISKDEAIGDVLETAVAMMF